MRLPRIASTIVSVGAVTLCCVEPTAAVEGAAAPVKGPPGAPVHVRGAECPPEESKFIGVRFRAEAGVTPPFDAADTTLVVEEIDESGRAELDTRVPIDTSPGRYAFDLFCVTRGGSAVEGPATVPFEVAILPMSVTPSDGPRGTQLTITGSGCPADATTTVAVRIHGASDDVAAFDPSAPDQVIATATAGSFVATLAVPESAPVGENAIEAFCLDGDTQPVAGPAFAAFVVSEPLATTGPGPLTAPLVVVGVAAIGIGAFTIIRRLVRLGGIRPR